MSAGVAGYNGSQIIVDDQNSTMITYNGNWQKGGRAGEYNSTEEGSASEGDFATFIFNGTSVAVYGTIPINKPPATPATAQFVLDNGSPVQYAAPLVSEITQQQLEYSSGPIPDGQHKLVITHTSNSAVINGAVTNQLWIDYFLIMPSPSNQSSETSTPVPAQSKTNVGAIAGGVVAGVVLIVAVILAVCFLYRRRRRKNGLYPYTLTAAREDIDPAMSKAYTLASRPAFTSSTAMTTPSHPSAIAAPFHSSSYEDQTSIGRDVPLEADRRANSSSQLRVAHPETTPGPSRRELKIQRLQEARSLPPVVPNPAGSAPRLHEDGGVRVDPLVPAGPDAPMDLPPVYRPNYD